MIIRKKSDCGVLREKLRKEKDPGVPRAFRARVLAFAPCPNYSI